MQETAIVKASLSKQIAEQLRAAIVDGRFKIGERLPTEDELAQRYGVSRPSVREALKRLAAQNLVRARRGPTGGNFVVAQDDSVVCTTTVRTAELRLHAGRLSVDYDSQPGDVVAEGFGQRVCSQAGIVAKCQ